MTTLTDHLLDRDFCCQVCRSFSIFRAPLILAFRSELEHDVWSHSAW